MTYFKQKIALELEKAVGVKDFSAQAIALLLEVPPSPDLGDFAFPVFRLAGIFKKDPKQIALELSQKIKTTDEIKEVKAVGPYVNFFLSKALVAKNVLPKILMEKQKFGKNKEFVGKKIMLEYSAPNTNKPLHIGHLRNNALAMSTGILLENSGAKLILADMFNDRGIHICQSMLAYQKWGNGKTPKSEKTKSDHFVGKYYVLYHNKEKENPALKEELLQMLKSWEAGDKRVLALWKKMNSWAEKGFLQTYKDFGSRFDVRYRESLVYKKARPIIELGLKKGVFQKAPDGAVIADLEKFGLGKKTVLRTDGTSIYLTQDLALAKQKFEAAKFDQSIYVVASEQNTYFKQLFKILELLGFEWAGKLFHLSYGLVNLPEGKLKSREGKIVDADNLLNDVKEMARQEVLKRYNDLSGKEVEKRSKAIALGAIKFFLLKTDPVKDVLFDPAKAVSFEGDSGPYVMYSFARAKSILRKELLQKKAVSKKIDFSVLSSEEERHVINSLERFEQVALEAAKSFCPNKVCNYLLELSGEFNSFYNKLPVIRAQKGVKEARLALVLAVSIVLSNGLRLLNIEPLEQM